MAFKPMLSAKAELDKIRWPVIASPKLDGVRCIIKDGVALSRTLKPIPSKFVQSKIGRADLNGLDGELIVGSPTDHDVYVKTNSGVMSADGEPDFTYFTFDRWDLPNNGFEDRFAAASPPEYARRVRRLPHTFLTDLEELRAYQESVLAQGYEGVMLRDPSGPYKQGRSTVKEGWLMKLKTFSDAEAVVIGIEEEMANLNEAVLDERGYTKRSTHKAGKTGKGTVGALVVRGLNGPFAGVEFNIGSGFTAEQRKQEWPLGSIVSYKFFEHGSKDRPRHPVFLRIRNDIDVEVAA